jgi:hypothetical protein
MTHVHFVSTTTRQTYYRSGQLREQVPLRNGQRHGVVRTWHKNGKPATEEPFQNGLLHGICRQWDEAGRLLGKYRMDHGTGLQRGWHENGQLQIEVSTLRGEFCGRNRIWLRDGTLISERFYLHGRVVGADEYGQAAANDKTLPKFRGQPAKLPPKSLTTEKHILNVFLCSLLQKRNNCEAGKWLANKAGDRTARLLGLFKREGDAAKFVQELYHAGAVEVIVPDIYDNNAGDQFADSVLVRLPKAPAKRKAVRKACAQLRKRKLGAVQPGADIGESHLFLSLV